MFKKIFRKIKNINKDKYAYWKDKKARIKSLSFEEYIKLNYEIIKEFGYNIIETKEYLWLILVVASCNNKKCLFISKNNYSNIELEKFADGMAFIEEQKKLYNKIYCVMQSNPDDMYGKLFIKCCSAQGIPIRTEDVLMAEIDEITGEEKPKVAEKRAYEKNKSGYKKIFPHVMTDDEDSDFEKAIDDMIFMDIMFDD